MVDFREIVPSTVKVKLDSTGESYPVPGLSLEALGSILLSNPEVAQIFEGKGFNADDPTAIVSLGSKFIAETIAAGLGYPGDERAIANAKALPPGDVLSVVEKILEVSFPGGAAAFLERITAAGQALSKSVQSGVAAPTKVKGKIKSAGKPKTEVSSTPSAKAANS